MGRKYKLKGVALIGTVAAILAWMMLAYGVFTVQSSQFNMIAAGKSAMEAQQYAEIDANLLKLINYDDIDDASVLSTLNLHTARGDIKTVEADGWQDEIVISSEQNNGSDDDGRFRVATVNIYKEGDSTPRYSMEVPLVSGAQTYTRQEIDEMVNLLSNNIAQLETNLTAYENATNATLSSHQSQITKNAQDIANNLSYLKDLIAKNTAAIAAANVNINKNASDISSIQAKITNINSQISSL